MDHLDLRVTYLYSVKFEFYHGYESILNSLEKKGETVSKTNLRQDRVTWLTDIITEQDWAIYQIILINFSFCF